LVVEELFENPASRWWLVADAQPQPTTNHQPPTTNYQLPTTNDEASPAKDYFFTIVKE
jgi:hypothetical protein